MSGRIPAILNASPGPTCDLACVFNSQCGYRICHNTGDGSTGRLSRDALCLCRNVRERVASHTRVEPAERDRLTPPHPRCTIEAMRAQAPIRCAPAIAVFACALSATAPCLAQQSSSEPHRPGAGSLYGWLSPIGAVADLVHTRYDVVLPNGSRTRETTLWASGGPAFEFALGARVKSEFALAFQLHAQVTYVARYDFQLVAAWLPHSPWSLQAGAGVGSGGRFGAATRRLPTRAIPRTTPASTQLSQWPTSG